MRKNQKQFTEKEVELLHNTQLTANELSQIFNAHPITIHRWRKKLGVELQPGAKAGKAVPKRVVRYKKTCALEGCNNTYYTVPSQDKKFCSRSCSGTYTFTHEVPSQAGKPKPWLIKEDRPEYIRYQQTVHSLSHKTYLENKHLINPLDLPRGRSGVKGAYQLDHIITVREGFEQGISPEELSKVSNLRMLPWEENLKRNRKNASH